MIFKILLPISFYILSCHYVVFILFFLHAVDIIMKFCENMYPSSLGINHNG